MIRQGFLRIPPPPTPPPYSPPSPPTSLVPPPPPPRFSMANTVKLPLFKGLENEDKDQLWFVVRAIWEAQGVTNDHIKKATLVSALQDHVLTWYIKYSNDNTNARVVDIQVALNREFSRPKSEVQSIVGFKEIMMQPSETPWEFDQNIEVSNPPSQYEFDKWASSRVVYGFTTTPLKDRTVTVEDNNSGRGLGDCHVTT